MQTSRSRYALLLLALALPAGLAAQGFEGTMKQKQIMLMPQGVAAVAGADVTDPQKLLEALTAKAPGADPSYAMTTDMTVTVKGSKMRIDGLNAGMGGTGYAIIDAAAGVMYTVIPQQKQIITMAAADADAVARKLYEQMGVTPPAKTPPTTSDLGTKTVFGVQAHGYRVGVPDAAGVVWVDPAMKSAFSAFDSFQQKMAGLNPGSGSIQAAMLTLGFPVLTDFVAKAPPMMGQGFLYSHVEVSQVQKQPVADDVFVLPTDYTRVTMAQMMGINP